MKKILTIAVVALGVLATTSCKKVYTCSCTNGTTTTTFSTGGKVKKSDAKTWCDGISSQTVWGTCSVK